MPIQCQCPSCGQTLRVPDSAIGKMVRCPKCQETFTAASSEADEPPPERPARRGSMELDQPPPLPPPQERPSRRADPQPDRDPPPPPRRDDYDDRDDRRPSRRRDEDEDDRRPSRRRDEDEDDRPSRRGNVGRDDYDDRRDVSSRRRDYDDRDDRDDRRRRDYDDDDDDPRMRRGFGGGPAKPSSVQTAGIMLLIGGIVAILGSLAYAVLFGISSAGICCLYPGYVYALISGILAIVRGSQLMGDNAYRTGPGTGIAIMLIINILNGDVFSMTMGIVALVMLSNDESRRYFGPSR